MAERKISTRLVLEGEKEYKASITNINRELKTLESALKLTESSFKGQANTVQALEAKNKALNDVIAKTAEKLNAENKLLDIAKEKKTIYGEAADAARKKLEELKKTTDDATKETEEYAKQVAVIQAEINKYEKAEAGAAAEVENHTQKANRAQTQINDLNGTLGENEKHLDEARRSTDGAAKSIDEFGKKTKDAGKESEEFGEKSSEAVDALASALAAAGVVASIKAIADALKESVDASIEFESAMAGVAKTTDLTSEELAAMGAEIKDLTLTIPITASEFAQIVEVAGQLGIAKDSLLDFSTVMANLGVSTNMTAEEAATMIAQFASITGMDASGYSRLGAAIVALGNNFATNEQKISDLSLAIAGAATNADISQADMLGLATAISSVGIEAQAGGTSMSSLISKITAAVETGDNLTSWAEAAGMSALEFAALWGVDATAALSAFIGNLNHLDESANVTLSTLGITETRMVRMITSLANAEDKTGLLTSAINTSNAAWEENTALVAEASTRYKTTESQITLYKNSVQNLKIAVGDELTPALQVLAEAGKNINEWATEFVETNEGLVPVITAVVVALGTFVGGLTLLGVGVPAITKAMAALHTVMAANPWILAATAIAAVVAALAALTVQAVAADRALHESTQNVLDSIEAKNEAYRTSTGELTKQNASVEVMAAKLNELAGIENKTAAQKALMLSLVEQLNEAVPELNLAYDDTSDTINMTAEEMKKVTAAMIEQAKQAAAVQRQIELYADEMEILYQLGDAQDRVTQAERDYKAAVDAHDRSAAIEAYKELTAAQQDVENLTDALVQNEGAQRGVTQAINEFGDAAANAGPAVQELSEETQLAADAISYSMQMLIDAYDASYSAAYENIEKTISGFGEMAATVPTHIQTVMDALDSQTSFIDTYMENLAKAAEMGMSEGLLAQLSDGSVESANILAGIVEDGGTKVQELNEKFQKVQEGKEAFATEIAQMQTDFAASAGEIVSDAEQMVSDLNLKLEAQSSGAETIQGYIDGLNSKLGQLAGIAAKINGYTTKGGSSDKGGSHAFGLDYVPYDDYNATLHKGEAVLTALEAKAWRAEQVANYSYPDNRVTNVTQHNYFTVPSKTVYDEIADAVNRRLGGEMP